MKKFSLRFFLPLALILGGIAFFFLIQKEITTSSKKLSKYEKQRNATKKAKGPKADAPDMHALIQRQLRTREGQNAPEYGPNQVMNEFIKAKSRSLQARAVVDEFDFIERGPGNVAGRTRALLVDPDDATGNTWYAGSASGGIWKTADAGANWAFISSDIPNLGTNTLAMSAANTQVIYAGTGEHFTNDVDGAGMFKSSDKGATWQQVASPSDFPDFKNVSRIAVDPNDENVVIATTRNSVWNTTGLEAAIYKTTDGGTSWTRLRNSTTERYDDIAVDSDNFDIVYVAINGKGVIKSTDGGATWSNATTGMTPGGRVEIAISSVNTSRLWASVQGGLSGTGSDLYVSSDGANSWTLLVNSASGDNEDFLGGQGWYDNYATAHPFDEDIVYVGGVNNWKFELGTSSFDAISSLDVSENGNEAFMSYVNFSASFFGGALEIGDNLTLEDVRSVEIRFGQGTQMAHRFTVGGQGAGVADGSYIYEDYVEVPFQVWDPTTNTQLMASFRDQQEDGAWNLIESNTAGDAATHSREYLYIHDVTYSETADNNIATNGGIASNQLYFLWSVLAPGATFDASNLPNSSLDIDVANVSRMERITSNVSDAYGDFGGPNSFPQSARTAGIHPDQHNSIITDIDDANKTFRLMITNDGGVYQSVSSTDPGPNEGDFTYVSYGYNTTQFYGADKAPGSNRYIGGMQDNGTWYHADGVEGEASSASTFGIGGDGFESLWHSGDANKMIGGSQFNGLAKTTNGGQSWTSATFGLTDTGSGNAPFVTKLSHHKQKPDRVHVVGPSGVWKSEDFGSSWALATLSEIDVWTSSFGSNAEVEVSYADPDVIWAGSRMSSTGRPFVSTDGGANYAPVANYSDFEMGSIAGMATHPEDTKTAYLLFSFSGFPKVIKTTDMGQNWEDISGFDGSGDRGFPDVAVNTLFVFPTDTDRIWVGSEIGIIESLDGGESWALLQSNMPAVNVYDFKLVENQLVIATYGRGIWSVTLDGIIVPPSFQSTFTSPNGDLNLQIGLANEYDSTEIYIDGSLIGTIYDNTAGSVTEKVNDSNIEGNVLFQIIGYIDGSEYRSPEFETFVFSVKDIQPTFGSGFDDPTDFAGFGLSIKTANSFTNTALHSPHNYKDGVEAIYYVKTPVTVAASDATLTYKDVAIIEPGEPESTYPNQDFYDYVVVEASSDGKNWIALEDGYDATYNPVWFTTYSAGGNGAPRMYVDHNINLLDKFSAGDNIIVRFRLFSDPNTNGFGWVVDDLYIQEERPLSIEKENFISVFPNPIVNSTEIQLNVELLENTIRVYSASGQIVDMIELNKNQQSVRWTPSNLETGVYILRLESKNGPINKKLFVK